MDRHWETLTFLLLLVGGGLLMRFLFEAADFYRWLRNLRRKRQTTARAKSGESQTEKAHSIGAGRA